MGGKVEAKAGAPLLLPTRIIGEPLFPFPFIPPPAEEPTPPAPAAGAVPPANRTIGARVCGPGRSRFERRKQGKRTMRKRRCKTERRSVREPREATYQRVQRDQRVAIVAPRGWKLLSLRASGARVVDVACATATGRRRQCCGWHWRRRRRGRGGGHSDAGRWRGAHAPLKPAAVGRAAVIVGKRELVRKRSREKSHVHG